MDRDILTTYDVAKILSVDMSTVIDWIDQKKLTGYRTPGGHRRVKREDLLAFLETYKMPLPKQFARGERVVLIVEDDEDFRLALRGFLKELYPKTSIHEAENGFIAGKMMEELKPDVIILDLYLPGINGFDVCQYIRKDPDLQDMKILSISGKNPSDVKQKILDAGANAFLPKPFGLAEFGAALDKLLADAPRANEPNKQPVIA